MIRPATHDDMGALLTMARNFHAASPYAAMTTYSAGRMQAVLESAIDGDDSEILVLDSLAGALGYEVGPSPFSDDLIGFEKFWWVEPSARGVGSMRLLQAAIADAKMRGAAFFTLSAPDAATTARALYERLGFASLDRAYIKAIP